MSSKKKLRYKKWLERETKRGKKKELQRRMDETYSDTSNPAGIETMAALMGIKLR